ncbi:hypothetical protein STCU_04700 [Strigomonas culicis]|nr:hypothetical protein STCU_04700 [Strigomonas culicis]|eukprot:EPY29150.1 hypothetical protein STCU_04700 [Strigomonas culicis]
MGMNPTSTDMDRLKERMTEPVLRLEQWRREEELKREKERRKEELKDKKKRGAGKTGKPDAKKQKGQEDEDAEKKDVKIIPVEEIKNIDWNIFISCTEEMYRDATSEEKEVYKALKIFREGREPKVMTRQRLLEILTTSGDNILAPAEVKLLETLLPEECPYDELAARIQGTYTPPTAQELAQKAEAEELERKRLEELKKPPVDDPLAGL